MTFAQPGTAPEAGSVTVVTHAAQISMPLAELVDLEKEKARIAKELKKNRGELEKLSNKLNNPASWPKRRSRLSPRKRSGRKNSPP